MFNVADFLTKIQPYLNKLSSEPVELSKCLGRVISANVISRHSFPTCNLCITKGYALKASNIQTIPVQFRVIGRSTNSSLYEGKVGPFEAVYVMSGTPLPEGTDVVIPEDAVDKDEFTITVKDYYTQGMNIAAKGIDIESGDVLFKPGTLITARHVTQAAAVKISWLPVVAQPKIGIIVSPEENLHDNSNFYLNDALLNSLASIITASGGIPIVLGVAVDMNATVEEVVAFKNDAKFAFQDMDIIVVAGGVHKPNDSLLWTTINQFGSQMEIHKVSIGSPENLIVGSVNKIPIIGLPGNLIANVMCGILFLRPMILKMLGIDSKYGFERKKAVLSRSLDVIDLQNDFLYSFLEEKGTGDLVVNPVSAQDCLMLSALSRSDCIIVVEKDKANKAGDMVQIIMSSNSIVQT